MNPLLLINPNTDAGITAAMLRAARACAPNDVVVQAMTVGYGAPLICDETSIAVAAQAVVDLAGTVELSDYSGVIVAAFGDPGLEELRLHSPVPVTGIAEAGVIAAARGGRRFGIVTTTPALVGLTRALVTRYGFADTFTGVRITDTEPVVLMAEPALLADELLRACEAAVGRDHAEAIIIGGGPLASAAATVRSRITTPIIEPVAAAVALASARIREIMHQIGGNGARQ